MKNSGDMKSFFGLKEKAGSAVRPSGAVVKEVPHRRSITSLVPCTMSCSSALRGCSCLVADSAYQRCKALLLAFLLVHPMLRL